jgi:Flp pilus assembly protein TadG
MKRLKRLICDEDAAELVEFTLSFLFLYMLVFGIIKFCLLAYTSNFVTFASQQGARYWMVRGSDWTQPCSSTLTSGCKAAPSDVQNYILSLPHPGIYLTTSNITPIALTTTAAGGTCTALAQGCQVQVTVYYQFGLNIPKIPASSVPFFSTSIETVQD